MSSFIFLLLILVLIWLSSLTFLFIKFYRYYLNLSKDIKKDSLLDVLNEIVTNDKELKKEIVLLKKNAEKIKADGSLHIQKIGLLRFNPFKDTGGDQSFILSLLDEQRTGVVISSLHSRTGTRWYAKTVMKGKGVEYSLSDDEQKAVEQADTLERIS